MRPLILCRLPGKELVVLGIREANEGEVVASEGLGGREVFVGRLVLYVVKVSGVVISTQIVHNGRDAVADAGEVPLVVLEERVGLDLLGSFEAQTGQPSNKKIKKI